ncbi:MAG: Holliday junction branch migration DNA helicase RuvB, partial [Halioglobus sp.]|nr:Holliday junction branch migration DNA helicase RuvB [Halioglobus sp.]
MIETDRLIAPAAQGPREDMIDRAIRPRTLDEYVGQKVVREQMAIFLQAALARGEPLDHTLIFGPPGLGKTTLA